MEVQTHLGNTLESMEELQARYDKNVKELLSDIQVLARIVKYTVKEVENYSIDEIMGFIDADSIKVGTVPVPPGLTNRGKVESSGTEDSVLNEGYIIYDIRFILVVEAKVLEIIVNVEAQKSSEFKKLKYHLENRIVYYLARLISSQKGIDFNKSEYDKIKKVYSIWICMDAEDDGDSISRIFLKSDTMFGKGCDFPYLDKMCGMVIRIRKRYNVAESKNSLIAMLEDVLSNEDSRIKKRKLEQKYDMKMTVELEGRIDSMCNLSEVVVENAREDGMEKGIEKGKRSTAVNLKKMGMKIEDISKAVGMSVETVRKWLDEGIEKGKN